MTGYRCCLCPRPRWVATGGDPQVAFYRHYAHEHTAKARPVWKAQGRKRAA